MFKNFSQYSAVTSSYYENGGISTLLTKKWYMHGHFMVNKLICLACLNISI